MSPGETEGEIQWTHHTGEGGREAGEWGSGREEESKAGGGLDLAATESDSVGLWMDTMSHDMCIYSQLGTSRNPRHQRELKKNSRNPETP